MKEMLLVLVRCGVEDGAEVMLRFQEGSFQFLEMIFTQTVVNLCSRQKSSVHLYCTFSSDRQ